MAHSKSQVSFKGCTQTPNIRQAAVEACGQALEHLVVPMGMTLVGHNPCRPHRPGRTLVATMGGRVPAGLWDHTGGSSCYVCAPGLGGCWHLGRDAGMPCSCSSSPTQLSRVHRNSVSVQVQSLGKEYQWRVTCWQAAAGVSLPTSGAGIGHLGPCGGKGWKT